MNKIILGDCLEKLKELADNSVDSIVSDPPYHLVSIVKRFGKEGSAPAQFGTDGAFSRASKGFMGKRWDGVNENGIGIAQNVELWKECLRVLKPGGHLLAFSGTRTYHRMASAIEDAGFEIRDMIEWVYGSGFPKSLNIGKAVDKLQGNERKEFDNPLAKKQTGQKGTNALSGDRNDNLKITKGTSEWEGWGTALKPAHEPICMARKPLAEKSVALNVLKYGTGGINIEESRVGTETISIHNAPKGTFAGGEFDRGSDTESYRDSVGRFPANLITDGSEEVRECFPESKGGGFPKQNINGNSVFGTNNIDKEERINMNDSGNASRFFKSIKKDLQYNQKHAILKLCENNISVNNAGSNLKTTSQIELVANIFSALKSATPNLDLLNQNLNALFVEKSADSIEIDFVAKCVAIKEIPEELVSQQDYTVFRDFMEDYKKCSQTQNPVSVEKWGNIDITQIMVSLLKLCGYVHLVIGENINSENREGQKCEYKSLVYIPKASKSERNKGLEDFPDQLTDDGRQKSIDNAFQRGETPRKNNHPTVKPIALMEYLIKMVTPKGGIVLDPFAGSGSTLVAAKQNGFQYIGIEMTPEYIPIIEARLKNSGSKQTTLL